MNNAIEYLINYANIKLLTCFENIANPNNEGVMYMKKAKLFSSLGVVSAAALALVACGKSSNNDNADDAKTASKFPAAVPAKETKQGGTLKLALLANSPFTGIFSNELSTVTTDSEVASPGNEALFDT
ncbi:hypothetical protein EQ500_13005, partial [Lactobacillus sp. XV13L]|nr:hypothetical protein [Lactobacillus sp. XV13L]